MTRSVPERLRPPYLPWEWAPSAVLLVWAVVDIATSDTVTGSRVLLGACLAVAAGCLVLRRRAPLASFVLAESTVLLPAAFGAYAESLPAVLVLVVAVFSVGRYGRRPLAYLALLLAVAVALLGSLADPTQTLSSSWGWSLNAVWIFAIGMWLREFDRRVESTRRQAEADARAAAAEERLRVARDLHDVLAHSLSTMVVQAEVADELLDRDPAAARRAVRNIQESGRSALRETRGVLGMLRDPSGSGGLAHVPDLVALFRSTGLPVTLEVEDGIVLDTEADTAAYRLVQEALTNALRHAAGRETRVQVGRQEGSVVLRVENDAPDVPAGAAPEERTAGGDGSPGAAPAEQGHGLIGMRERVEACGGRFVAGPLPVGGFAVEAVLPVPGGGA